MVSTIPADGEPTGTSIFIDSMRITGWFGVTESPTVTRIFQTIPVMGATTAVLMDGANSTEQNVDVKREMPDNHSKSIDYADNVLQAGPRLVTLKCGNSKVSNKPMIFAERCTK